MRRTDLRAARANRVFKHGCEKKQGQGEGFIQDRRSRTDCFSSVRDRRSARTGRRPRKLDHRSSSMFPHQRRSAKYHCALSRANRVFCTDEKRIRTENTVMKETRTARGFIQVRAPQFLALFHADQVQRIFPALVVLVQPDHHQHGDAHEYTEHHDDGVDAEIGADH